MVCKDNDAKLANDMQESMNQYLSQLGNGLLNNSNSNGNETNQTLITNIFDIYVESTMICELEQKSIQVHEEAPKIKL